MRDLPAPVYVSSVRARGLRPRRGGTTLAMTTCSVLPSVPYDAVGPPNSIFLSRLNTQPTRCPVNASPLPSRTATHDSGPTWFATPWLGGTCTRETYRFVPAHREIKIELKRRLHHPVPEVGQWLRSVMQGHFNYYAVPRNQRKLGAFKYQVYRLWLRTLRQRSQRHRMTGERMNRLADRWFPPIRILYPYPEQRLRVMT